jgi:Glucodextranase, domain B
MSNSQVSSGLIILVPQDGSTVKDPLLDLNGQTMPGAVVSIDNPGEASPDDLVVVVADSSGLFSARVTLLEGPNLIDVVASDDLGNQKVTSFTVYLENNP